MGENPGKRGGQPNRNASEGGDAGFGRTIVVMIVAVAVAVLPAVGGAVRVAKATWCLRWRPRRRRSPLTELKAERARQGIAFTRADLYAAIMGGAVERVRPKMMTVAAMRACCRSCGATAPAPR